MIKVLLVDDHELVRTGIKRIINDVRGLSVVGEACCGEDAYQICRANQPDVVLMDMNMPGIGGLEATKKILRFCPDVKVIMLTVQVEDPFPTKVMEMGAHGFLTKSSGYDEVIDAIKKVNSGQIFIAQEIAQKIALNKFSKKSDNPFEGLSNREVEIMSRITKGDKVADIAEQLNLSTKTVNSYRYRLFEKLSISNDVELTHLAIRHGMLEIDKL